MEIEYNYIGNENHPTYEIYVTEQTLKSITYTKPIISYHNESNTRI